MLEIKSLHGRGRAVVARCAIEKGRIIESAPSASFSPQEREAIKMTHVFEHCFVRFDEYSKSHPCPGYIVFGLSSLCNHSELPNAYIEWEMKKETGLWANLRSLRDINAGEEITLYYTDIDDYSNSSAFV